MMFALSEPRRAGKDKTTRKTGAAGENGKAAISGRSGKARIWEIDAVRGFGILCVTLVHFFSFRSNFYRPLYWPPVLHAIRVYGGSSFVFWAGLSASLPDSLMQGNNPGGRTSGKGKCRLKPDNAKVLKRGLKLLVIGLVLTGLSCWLYYSGREPETVLIQWGVLHCIGACLLLYPLVRRFPQWLKYVLGAVIVAAGYYIAAKVRVQASWLFPLGLRRADFTYFDYFPLMPQFGWFLTGNATGFLVYGSRKPAVASRVSETSENSVSGIYSSGRTLFPGTNTKNPLVRFFTFFGRHSLETYLAGYILFYLVFSSLR